jgi:hypothetical protein
MDPAWLRTKVPVGVKPDELPLNEKAVWDALVQLWAEALTLGVSPETFRMLSREALHEVQNRAAEQRYQEWVRDGQAILGP